MTGSIQVGGGGGGGCPPPPKAFPKKYFVTAPQHSSPPKKHQRGDAFPSCTCKAICSMLSSPPPPPQQNFLDRILHDSGPCALVCRWCSVPLSLSPEYCAHPQGHRFSTSVSSKSEFLDGTLALCSDWPWTTRGVINAGVCAVECKI